MNSFARFVHSFAQAMIVLFLSLVMLAVFIHYPNNHGIDMHSFVPWICVMLILSLLDMAVSKRIWLVEFSLILYAFWFIAFVDTHNMMMSYSTWISRGMPEWNEPSRQMSSTFENSDTLKDAIDANNSEHIGASPTDVFE